MSDEPDVLDPHDPMSDLVRDDPARDIAALSDSTFSIGAVLGFL